jgi:hypothetical protein
MLPVEVIPSRYREGLRDQRFAADLGATVAEHQPQRNVRVLFDPAGHPFCLCLDED